MAVAGFAPVLAMSQSGTMVYLPGRTGGGANLATAVWVDRSGLITPLDS
ncbi:MAG: hypothetical protein GWO22_00750, partial [Actinobacteria bacterium]|nr:hypothetical protein [Actinomycetota bacterium]NIT94025.1 hypothetical protein [Actinomycetota bacterium]NIV56953.1 hypothetical protein [Actinomycetota bacterium]NIX49010.1 hypothetical protein [Actinomycetota bacterium]